MQTLLERYGSIKDLGCHLHWDSADFTREIHRRAAALADHGVGRGSVVAIAHDGTARFFADLFSVWATGAAAACLDSTLTPGEIQNVVRFANCNLLLVDDPEPRQELTVPVLNLSGVPDRDGATVMSTVHVDDPALVLFTSGTTGTPKGVVITFKALFARVTANIAAIGSGRLSRTLVTLPTFFGHGLIGNSLTPLLAGGEIVLHPRGMPLINNLASIIDEQEITFMSSVPSFWRLVLACDQQLRGGSLRRVHIGSAPLSTALWSAIAAWSKAEVVNCYGITETANWIAGASSDADGIHEGLVGHMWGGKAAIRDDSGALHHQGIGEIVVQSDCLMSGYFNRPDLTAAAFTEGWFRTGDYGSIDENERIWVTGRIKDEINRGGFKVQPAELDSLLETHPAVAEACVFGVPETMGGEAIAAAIRLKNGENVSALSLQHWCSQRLRRAAVPDHWFFVSEIPRTARGKVSRDVVCRTLTQTGKNEIGNASPDRSTTLPPAARPLDRPPVSATLEPGADAERMLLALWREIIGIETLGVEDDFFAMGGTSLMAARLFAEISTRFGVKMPLSTILETPTVRALSYRLKQPPTAPKESLVHLRRGGSRCLFIVHDGVGETLLYMHLARHMPEDLTVIGIEPRRLAKIPLAHTRVEDMARFYIEQMRTRQSHGPYLLAGMCAGGVVAYEMAAQLLKCGEKVELVGLLDAITPQTTKSNNSSKPSQPADVTPDGRSVDGNDPMPPTSSKNIFSAVSRKLGHGLSWRASHYSRSFFESARFELLRLVLSRNMTWPAFLPPLDFQQTLNAAQARYKVKSLPISSIVLARATAGEGADTPYKAIFNDETLGWGAVAKNLTIVDVDGGHESMLREPFVKSLATALIPYVQDKAALAPSDPSITEQKVGVN
jgi:acyl-CoA synthetase (AMP-forming)/AMP-acid ligase II/thioesterase domain-containing protein